MADSTHRPSRGTVELVVIRRTTLATLWLITVVAGFVQLLVGVDSSFNLREVLLVVGTLGATGIALATMPLVIRDSNAGGWRHPMVIAGVVLSVLVWGVAVVPPFAGWGWALTLAISGGVLSCLVTDRWRLFPIVATYLTIGLAYSIEVLISSPVAARSSRSEAQSDIATVAIIAVFTLMPVSTVWVLHIAKRLDRAREIAAELAVAEERLRFATDLHDIQGHNLQVIALKSELAGRVLGAQPERAAHEIAAIRALAQTAIDDTRAVVNDYRTVTVAVEVRNAAAVLQSAGIRCAIQIDTLGMPADVGAVFAVAIREATTNVLRHSRATEATIDLGWVGAAEYGLTVSNNRSVASGRGGTGLTGLTSRAVALGGTVETHRRKDFFTLTVRIPASGAPTPLRGRRMTGPFRSTERHGRAH